MNKKRRAVQSKQSKRLVNEARAWQNGGDIELHLYGRALRRAAKTIIANLDLKPNPVSGWDAAPIILLYRHAMELHLKELVGEGSGLLQNPVDPLTLYKTYSLRWLAQIVCQIIKAVGWEATVFLRLFNDDHAGMLSPTRSLMVYSAVRCSMFWF